MSHERESIAQTLIADGKGILAADETIPTLTRRFDTLGIQSTEQSRRTYRETLGGEANWRKPQPRGPQGGRS
jgi:fructose-bisphosphate aldolase class I